VSNVAKALLLLLAVMPAAVVAQDDLRGRNWAGACTGCHGTEGRSVGSIPAIAGMEKARFVELMTSFRTGGKEATVMHQHARGLTDEQIDAMGDYFSSREPE
jgi:sulfide dehydrogenase cytochrome subunit